MRCCEPHAKVSVAEHGELLGRLVELAHLGEGSRMLLVLLHRLVPLPASSALDAELGPAPVQRVRAGPGVTEHVEARAEDGKARYSWAAWRNVLSQSFIVTLKRSASGGLPFASFSSSIQRR